MASYATPTDLASYAINPTAFAGISTASQQAQLDAASTVAEGYLSDQYHLPIVAPYPIDLKMAVCSIAAFFLMTFRGYQPGGADEMIRMRYDDAIKWLSGIAQGMISPGGIIDSTPNTREGGPRVVSGTMGNVVGGYGPPSTSPIGAKPYAYTGTVPGRRGW
jgi:phage gp36-like protein